VIRHSAEHVLADAVERLFPGTIIDAGRQDHAEKFQYDFRFPRGFTPEDLEKIETEMARIVAEDRPFERQVVSREQAREIFRGRGEEIKLFASRTSRQARRSPCSATATSSTCAAGRTSSAPARSARSACSRPRAPTSRATSATRCCSGIYGTAFAGREELDAYFAKIEEARRRDHRRLGRELDLFSFSPLAPASPFFHPRGAVVYNELVAFMRELYKIYGYQEW